MFGIWLGQLISEFGIPNQGLSLIIFAGISRRIPSNLIRILADKKNGWWMFILILALLALTIFAIVFVQQGRRNVPVLFPGRRMGNRMSMPVRSNLPLMVNMAGMIPLIFAQTILSFPALSPVTSLPVKPRRILVRRLHTVQRQRMVLSGNSSLSWWLRLPSSTRMCCSPSRIMVKH